MIYDESVVYIMIINQIPNFWVNEETINRTIRKAAPIPHFNRIKGNIL